MRIGYIGLGKMGIGMCLLMKEKGHDVIAWNRSDEGKIAGRNAGLNVENSLEEMVAKLPQKNKIIWIMVSHEGLDAVIKNLLPLLSKGDTIIDGGNCKYTETIKRAKMLEKKGINFLDAGVSGGPDGSRNGACVMIGGKKKDYEKLLPIWKSISRENGYTYFGDHGAGHFVKMVHNGIEYGMMQAIGEGFEILRKSQYNLDLNKVTALYDTGSVIESRLIGWLQKAYKESGKDLKGISGSIKHSGEGLWTVETAKKMKVPTPIIEGSLDFRIQSQTKPSYTGKVVSALRNQFGHHEVKEKK